MIVLIRNQHLSRRQSERAEDDQFSVAGDPNVAIRAASEAVTVSPRKISVATARRAKAEQKLGCGTECGAAMRSDGVPSHNSNQIQRKPGQPLCQGLANDAAHHVA